MFTDFPEGFVISEKDVKAVTGKAGVPVRMYYGMARTSEEDAKYREESQKRPLP